MIHWLAADHTKNVAEDNQESFLHYTELGWEVTIGRLKVIRMITEGKISKNDTIITLKDRMFMYSKFCNVLPFDGNPIKTSGLTPSNHNYTNWLKELHIVKEICVPWRWEIDVPLILDFDYIPVNPPLCVVINHRVRGYGTSRNIDEDLTRSFVSISLELGYKPYISGRYADKIDSRAEYVPSLRTTMSLVHHPNCVAFIASGGPVLLGQQCCCNKLILPNVCEKSCHNSEGYNGGHHPLFLSDYMNFSKCQQFVIPYGDTETVKKIIKK